MNRDVLWMCSGNSFSDTGNYPSHTALVTSVERDSSASEPYYNIYTLEGNLPVYADGKNTSEDDALYRTVERRVRNIAGTKATGNKVFAIGRVAYAPQIDETSITANLADITVDGSTLVINSR